MSNTRFHLGRLPWAFWAVSLLVILFDQFTKNLAQANLAYAEPTPVTSFFYLTLRYNEGAAFSFLAGAGGWQRWLFTAIATTMSVVLMVWIARVFRQPGKRLEALALAFILGGALGNLYDRVLHGHVVDFLVFHYQQYEWPAFNVADSAIFVGAGLLILDMIKGRQVKNA